MLPIRKEANLTQGRFVIPFLPAQHTVYKLDPSDGNVVKTLNLSNANPGGAAWGDGFLWITDEYGDKIHQIDPSAKSEPVVNTFNVPRSAYPGATWDGEYLWTGDNPVYRIDLAEIGQPNAPPNVTFNYTPASPAVGQEVSMNASGSEDSDGYIERYEWDFDGDGVADARGEQVTHTFDSAGSHIISLTVIDESGTSSTANRNIQIVEATTNTDSSPRSTEENVQSRSTTKRPSSTSETAQDFESSAAAPTTTNQNSITDSSSTTTLSDSGEVERGFFSNGPNSGSSDLLANPFLLTLGGFIFSAAGILLQLSRGG